MPAQTQKNVNVAALLGAGGNTAFEENKNLQPTGKNERLPEGIDNGVAMLKKAWIGIYQTGENKGKPFYMASGVVILPKIHNGIKVEGRHTQVGPEPMFETPKAAGKRKTYVDHYGWMMNELMLLNPALAKNRDAMRPQNLEQTFNALVKAGICFRFRTYKMPKNEPEQRGGQWYLGVKGPYASLEILKQKNKFWNREPMVNEEWLGACPKPTIVDPNATPEEAGVIDETGDVNDTSTVAIAGEGTTTEEAAGGYEPVTEEVVGEEPQTTEEGAATEETPSEEVTTPEEGEEIPVEEGTESSSENAEEREYSLEELVEMASADNNIGKARLEEMAVALGYTPEDVFNSSTWQEVADWITAGTGPETAEETPIESADEQETPEPAPPPAPKVQAKPAAKPAPKAPAAPSKPATPLKPAPAKPAAPKAPAAKPTVAAPKAPATPKAPTAKAKEPKVGDTGWKLNLKDGKGQIKATNVEVLTISAKDKTVTVKNLTTGRPVIDAAKKPINVKWTDLMPG